MNATEFSDISVTTAPAENWTEALELVFRGRESDSGCTQQQDALARLRADAAEKSAGLFEARRGGRLLGAVWVQMHPKRTASMQPPSLSRELAEPLATSPGSSAVADFVVDELVRRTVAFACDADARLVQVLLPPDSGPAAYRLREVGFQRLAELYFLVSPAAAFPAELPATELEFEAMGEHVAVARDEGREVETGDGRRRLAAMIERTYAGTLDCPRLNGVLPVDEILDGYRAVGQFDPRRWLLVRHAGSDVGCLLLAKHPGRIWELLYMGLAPEARGRRWGWEIARYAQGLAGQEGAERMVLAVDAENAPAIRAYTAAGFVARERRSAWLKVLAACCQL